MLFCCLFFSLKISAQSYHAGDITYSWISGYTYSVKLTTFTGIGSGGLGDACQETLCNGNLINRTNGPIIVCGGGAHDGVPISSTIKLNEYITTRTYSGPGDYTLCFGGSYRNSGIVNIPNSVNQGIGFESYLNIPLFSTGKNNSPVFANFPIAYGCLNNGCFTYNPLATDTDGDSLSYKLVPCTTDFGPVIPGYSFPGAGSVNVFSIDSLSGLVSWCNPQFAGDYNVGIKIEEWRKNDDGDYFLIGYVIRDTQFTIENCTGVSDIVGKDQNISLYPNPATDYLEIRFTEASDELYSIVITDVAGKTVAGLLKDSAIKPTMTFDMKELSAGIYFVKITGKHRTITKKLIKQ